jgi:hypothetical protein
MRFSTIDCWFRFSNLLILLSGSLPNVRPHYSLQQLPDHTLSLTEESPLHMTGPTPMVSTDGLIQCVEQSWTPPVLFHAVILGNLRMLQSYFIGVDTYLNEQKGVLAYLFPWRVV